MANMPEIRDQYCCMFQHSPFFLMVAFGLWVAKPC
jgi:hypothetical protein